MLNFFKEKPPAAEPEESCEALRARRVGELLDELHRVESELARIETAARRFLREHVQNVNGHERLRANGPEEARALEATWLGLVQADYKLNLRKNKILADLAAIRPNKHQTFVGGKPARFVGGVAKEDIANV